MNALHAVGWVCSYDHVKSFQRSGAQWMQKSCADGQTDGVVLVTDGCHMEAMVCTPPPPALHPTPLAFSFFITRYNAMLLHFLNAGCNCMSRVGFNSGAGCATPQVDDFDCTQSTKSGGKGIESKHMTGPCVTVAPGHGPGTWGKMPKGKVSNDDIRNTPAMQDKFYALGRSFHSSVSFKSIDGLLNELDRSSIIEFLRRASGAIMIRPIHGTFMRHAVRQDGTHGGIVAVMGCLTPARKVQPPLPANDRSGC